MSTIIYTYIKNSEEATLGNYNITEFVQSVIFIGLLAIAGP